MFALHVHICRLNRTNQLVAKMLACYRRPMDRKSPNAYAMVYHPFDRQPRAGVETLTQFFAKNMAITEIAVRFSDVVTLRSNFVNMDNTLTYN